MNDSQDKRLRRLLKEAYPSVEVSPDFTLQLWKRLMKQPGLPPWMLPAPAYAMAAVVGVVMGIWAWTQGAGSPFPDRSRASALAQVERWDLFGNAPFDSVAGSYLRVRSG